MRGLWLVQCKVFLVIVALKDFKEMLNFLKVAESISIGETPSFSKVSTLIHLTCSASTFVARL